MRSFTRFGLLLIAGLTGCQSDESAVPVYNVPTTVQRYVRAFYTEAGQRGQSVDTTNLIITFGTPPAGPDACGQCELLAGKPPRITLNPNGFCWAQAADAEREGLVFHELGHCLLRRLQHRTDRFPNGAYASLMNPDDVDVYATCRYPIGGDVCDKRPRRGYYVDELFNPTTPAPAWGK